MSERSTLLVLDRRRGLDPPLPFSPNHRWGLITALCRTGFAALALGDPVDEQLPPAYDYARPALQSLEAKMSTEDLAAARDAAAHTTLAELVQQALAVVPAPTAAATT